METKASTKMLYVSAGVGDDELYVYLLAVTPIDPEYGMYDTATYVCLGRIHLVEDDDESIHATAAHLAGMAGWRVVGRWELLADGWYVEVKRMGE